MLVSEAIAQIRARINDEYDTGYTDDLIIQYINNALTYIVSALIDRNDPSVTDYMDVDGTSEDNPVPKNFARFAGNFPVMIKGKNFHVVDGSVMVTVRFFFYPDRITAVTDELPFKGKEYLQDLLISLASVYALNQHEFNVQQDEVLKSQIEQLIVQALGAIT